MTSIDDIARIAPAADERALAKLVGTVNTTIPYNLFLCAAFSDECGVYSIVFFEYTRTGHYAFNGTSAYGRATTQPLVATVPLVKMASSAGLLSVSKGSRFGMILYIGRDATWEQLYSTELDCGRDMKKVETYVPSDKPSYTLANKLDPTVKFIMQIDDATSTDSDGTVLYKPVTLYIERQKLEACVDAKAKFEQAVAKCSRYGATMECLSGLKRRYEDAFNEVEKVAEELEVKKRARFEIIDSICSELDKANALLHSGSQSPLATTPVPTSS